MIRQFNDARSTDYSELITPLNQLIARRRKNAADMLVPELAKLRRQFDYIRQLDFFDCPRANDVAMLFERAAELPTKSTKGKKAAILALRRFAAKTWLTRPQPEIDRVGSA